MVSKEILPEKEWTSSPDQNNQLELPCVKEEQEEVWSCQDREQLCGVEAEIIEFTYTPVPLRSNDVEQKLQTSQLHQPAQNRDSECPKTEAGEEDYGREPVRNLNPDHLQPAALSSEPQSCYVWEVQNREHLQSNKEPVSDEECNPGQTSYLCSEHPSGSGHKEQMQVYGGSQTVVKPFSCSVCGNRFTQYKYLKNHMRLHSDGKSLSCSVCKKTFLWKTVLDAHMRIHTGEKPYGCSVCGARFTHGSNLTSHLKIHSGVKPYTCSVCKMSFSRRHHLSRHMKIHTGEKPFSCYFCGKTFRERAYLTRHMNGHTGESV